MFIKNDIKKVKKKSIEGEYATHMTDRGLISL